MLMSVRELNGLGDLGRRFSLKKAVKRLNPVALAKKSIQLAKHPKEMIKVLKAYNPAALTAKTVIRSNQNVFRFTKKFTQKAHKRHMVWLRKIEKNKIAGPIFNAVVMVVATYFGVSGIVAPAMKVWLASEKQRSAAIAAGETEKHSAADVAQAEADLHIQIVGAGYSAAEADQIIAQLRQGVDPTVAIQSIGPPHPLAAASVPEAAPIQAERPMGAPRYSGNATQTSQASARDQFLKWFSSWKPQEAAALRASNPELFAPLVSAPLALADHDALGAMFGEVAGLGQDEAEDGGWAAAFSSWADTAAKIVPSVLNNLTAVKTLQLQLQRSRAGLPPLPTRTAQQVAVTGRAPLSFSLPLVISGVLVLALGAVFVAPRFFGRRHHSRFM